MAKNKYTNGNEFKTNGNELLVAISLTFAAIRVIKSKI